MIQKHHGFHVYEAKLSRVFWIDKTQLIVHLSTWLVNQQIGVDGGKHCTLLVKGIEALLRYFISAQGIPIVKQTKVSLI